MWVRYVNPESALGVPLMLDVLLVVITGGIGTLWGGKGVLGTPREALARRHRAGATQEG